MGDVGQIQNKSIRSARCAMDKIRKEVQRRKDFLEAVDFLEGHSGTVAENDSSKADSQNNK